MRKLNRDFTVFTLMRNLNFERHEISQEPVPTDFKILLRLVELPSQFPLFVYSECIMLWKILIQSFSARQDYVLPGQYLIVKLLC
jgi:hypothetical protein